MSLELSLNKAKELGMWVHERIDRLILPQNDHVRIGGACLHLALEHYHAINVLIEARLYGSAFALARPLLEAYARGIWLLNSATESQLQSYMKGKLPKFGEILNAIGDRPETGGFWLKEIKKKNWVQFNDLVHGGAHQVARRNTEDGIESSYPEEELSRLLGFSGEVAIQLATQFFVVAGDELRLIELKNKATTIRSPS
jgi:hypothetical protein